MITEKDQQVVKDDIRSKLREGLVIMKNGNFSLHNIASFYKQTGVRLIPRGAWLLVGGRYPKKTPERSRGLRGFSWMKPREE